jgi:predicted RNase H-like nuclease (RuvC/YqgF family)
MKPQEDAAMSIGIELPARSAQGGELGTRPREAREAAETGAQAVAPAQEAERRASGGMEAYVVELSEAAKRLSRQGNPFARALEGLGGAGSGGDQDEEDGVDRQIREIQKRIEALRKELDEIRQGEGSEEEKRSQAAVKEAEIAALQAQLMELTKRKGGQTMPGGSGGSGAFYNTGSLT